MKENSPICARLAPTVSAVLRGYRNARTSAIATIGFPTITIPATASNFAGSSTTTAGSKSIPTETKKSTAKASRNGSDSSAAR